MTEKATELSSRATRRAPASCLAPADIGARCARTARTQGLWDYAAAQPALPKSAETRRRESAQETRGDVRSARVRLVPPGDRTGGRPLSAFAVSVVGLRDLDCRCSRRRANPGKTTRREMARWTECFKTLKSGRGVESRRFDGNLRKCLVLDAAYRILDFLHVVRDRPDAGEDEIAVPRSCGAQHGREQGAA